ncbi:MAG TPA: ribosome biogenesis GTPase Der [Candidatus Binatia bacterium]|nr:ribosome biogenesis GTPase Der [Candidatus Binatia bacterium]
MSRLPVLALVGRTNVGKSTLFNRLTHSRDALVSDLPGLTRDRQYGFGALDERRFIVVDTGGLMSGGDALARMAERQARAALDEADTVLFVVDVRAGLTGADRELADDLRKRGKPVFVAANKSESLGPESAAEFFGLGLGEPWAISAEHGQGVEALLAAALAGLADGAPEADEKDDGAIRVAIVGRPNVGKSTLVNRLVGEDRVLAHGEPGTTRDAIAVPFERDGQRYVLVDTAGIRRRARVEEHVEKLSVVKSLQAIERADVVIAVVDAQSEIGVHDARLLGLAAQRGRGLVLAVNKWDGLTPGARERVSSDVDFKLPFLDFMPVHHISAMHGSGLAGLMADVREVYESTRRELPTPALTRALEAAVEKNQPPAVVGRRIKLRYAHAGGRNPPVIVVHGNQTERLPGSYKRYLANEFRAAFQLKGVPVVVEFRTGDNPYKGRNNELTPRQRKRRQRVRGR